MKQINFIDEIIVDCFGDRLYRGWIMTEYEDGIKAARTELESLSACRKSWDRCIADKWRLKDKMGVVPSHAPAVGLRKSWRLVPTVSLVTGIPTGKKHRESVLVPCHISVQTQQDPHREEARHAEMSFIEHTLKRKRQEMDQTREYLTKRIDAVQEPQRKILHLKYIDGLSLDEITSELDWFYSYRQVGRNMNRAVEMYARIHGFINE